MDGYLLLSVGAGVVAMMVTVVLLGPLVRWLRHRALLDVPNDRSSHVIPTPRGGGIVVTSVVVLGWSVVLVTSGTLTASGVVVLVAAVGLGLLSWLDDLLDLPRRLRFLLHVAAVLPVLMLLPPDMMVAQGLLPLWLDRLIAALAWLWFINLFNFMDGIDGISGVQAAHLGVALSVLVLAGGLSPLSPEVAPLGAVVAGAAVGFLWWNWHPAKVFLGDVGSIPLGYLLGWLMLWVAAAGHWAVALILPAYYWADATITLVRRAARGAHLVVAHREHFYQRATHVLNMRHSTVAGRIAIGNLLLLGAAGVAVAISPWAGLVVAIVPVAALLAHFGRAGASPQATEAKRQEMTPR